MLCSEHSSNWSLCSSALTWRWALGLTSPSGRCTWVRRHPSPCHVLARQSPSFQNRSRSRLILNGCVGNTAHDLHSREQQASGNVCHNRQGWSLTRLRIPDAQPVFSGYQLKERVRGCLAPSRCLRSAAVTFSSFSPNSLPQRTREEDTFARSWVPEMKVRKGRQVLSSKRRSGRLPYNQREERNLHGP